MTEKLTLLDRCDRCNAAAKVIATKENKELYFCEHHRRKYENFKSLTQGFLLQQEQTDHERIAQKIHQWAQEQGENNE